MEEPKDIQRVDTRRVFQEIWKRKRLFLITLPIAFVLSALYIICIPRYYTTDTKVAPETGNDKASGTLGSIASSFGINLSDMQTSDAITPLLYPDLMEDNGFVTSLFGIKVRKQDGSLTCNYHDYLQKHQKAAWWTIAIAWVGSLLPAEEGPGGGKGTFDPYTLSRTEDNVAGAIRNNIKLSADKKTGVITISVKDQDPLICKTLADSVREHLKGFITQYRTTKARNDLNYYTSLAAEAKQAYERARRLYGSYSDANTEVILESYKSKQEDLENDMQLKYNTYSTLTTQLQAAKAKVQERTPAFTLLKGAAVPVRPAGPKRMLFVLYMLLLTAFGTGIYILKDILRSGQAG